MKKKFHFYEPICPSIKIAVTLDLVMQFERPLRFSISQNYFQNPTIPTITIQGYFGLWVSTKGHPSPSPSPPPPLCHHHHYYPTIPVTTTTTQPIPIPSQSLPPNLSITLLHLSITLIFDALTTFLITTTTIFVRLVVVVVVCYLCW